MIPTRPLVAAALMALTSTVGAACVKPTPRVGTDAELRESAVFDVVPFAGEPITPGVPPPSAAVVVDVPTADAPTTLAAVVRALAGHQVSWLYATCADGAVRVDGEEQLAPGNATITLRLDLEEEQLLGQVEGPQEGDTQPVAGGPPSTFLDDCPPAIADALDEALS